MVILPKFPDYRYGPISLRYDVTGGSSSGTLASETRYLYDGRRVIQERSVADTPLVSYTRGWDLSGSFEGAGGIGGMLARSHGYSGGNWSTHDPYGNLVSSSGTMADSNLYRFSSKEYNETGDIYYYGYRFYDPIFQRWLNQDPLGEAGGINLYGFVYNRPSGLIDPFGLSGTNPGSGTGGMCTREYWELTKWMAEEVWEEVTGLPAPGSPRAIARAVGRKTGKEAIDKGRRALKISEDKARKELRNDLDLPPGQGRAHHNIPIQQRNHPIVQKAADGGFDFNNAADNGTALKDTFHNGYPDWHRAYNEAVGKDLDDLAKRFPNMTPEEAADALKRNVKFLSRPIECCWLLHEIRCALALFYDVEEA